MKNYCFFSHLHTHRVHFRNKYFAKKNWVWKIRKHWHFSILWFAEHNALYLLQKSCEIYLVIIEITKAQKYVQIIYKYTRTYHICVCVCYAWVSLCRLCVYECSSSYRTSGLDRWSLIKCLGGWGSRVSDVVE